MTTKIIKANNEFQLVKLMNEESKKLDIFATKPIQKNDDSWVCFLYFNSTKDRRSVGENFSKKPEKDSFVTNTPSKPATERQINLLKKLKVKYPEQVTKLEAMKLIDEALNKKEVKNLQ